MLFLTYEGSYSQFSGHLAVIFKRQEMNESIKKAFDSAVELLIQVLIAYAERFSKLLP